MANLRMIPFLRHAYRWAAIASVLIAFYFLSIGPAAYFFKDTPDGPVLTFFRAFYLPLEWLAEYKPLRDGLNAYVGWFTD